MNKTLAFDIQSGDHGPSVAYPAAVDFLTKNKDWKIVAFATEDFTIPADKPENIEVVYCTQKIEQTDSAMQVMRKKDSTLVRAIQYVIEGNASAVVSPAASGPLVTAGYLFSKPMNEEIKPAFAPIYGSAKGSLKIVLDVGANLDADAATLEKYAIMGQEFAKAMNISTNPTVGLLNIGSEEKKGKPLQVEAHQLLKENENINFVGNIEPNEMFSEGFDVAVADAYSGNLVLKSWEGGILTTANIIKESAKRSLMTKIGLLLASDLRKSLKVLANEDKIGGAVVLGLNNIVVKAHGGSKKQMLTNSLGTAKNLVEADITNKIKNLI